jgi:hypothetical protein
MAAAARIHRGHELKPRRIDRAMIGSRNGDFAGFERLAQTVAALCSWLTKIEFR